MQFNLYFQKELDNLPWPLQYNLKSFADISQKVC